MAGTGGAHAIKGYRDRARGCSQAVSPSGEAAWQGPAWPLARRLSLVAVGGAAGAIVVGYVTFKDPTVASAQLTVALRVLMTVLLLAAGVYGCTSRSQVRIGALLIGLGLYSALWLSDGSSTRLLFSGGLLCSAFVPMLLAYLMLATPTGRLPSPSEQRLVWGIGGGVALLGTLALLTSGQPLTQTPLMACRPQCQPRILSIGPAAGLSTLLETSFMFAWVALACGVPVLIWRRARSGAGPVRRSAAPVGVVAAASAFLLIAELASRSIGSGLDRQFGVAYAEAMAALPLAILIGLRGARPFTGGALVDFVNQLGETTGDPLRLMASTLHDPSLWIANRHPRTGADQERFLRAAGAAALMRLEKARLEADLKASTRELEASRVRLMEAANTERRRFGRDLHHGVQQRLTALRLELDRAGETIERDAIEGEQLLVSMGEHIDEIVLRLRSLARGIYPVLLDDQGVTVALKSAARDAPIPVVVRGSGVGRYPEDVEAAVYFCCLDALQYIAKHAGPDAEAEVQLWQAGAHLCFQVRGSRPGFEPEGSDRGSELDPMDDCIQAVGGTLTVSSAAGHSLSARGVVPALRLVAS